MWWVGTRKGLLRIEASRISGPSFPGVPVTMVLPTDNVVYAAVEHGHFGPKIHRSDDRGETWTELGQPVFPEGTEASVKTVWSLERASDGRLWLGTIPGGLFTSDDGGASWALVRTLWDLPERAAWVGGGADQPGVHSVCIHPTDPADVVIGVSVGGAWRTRDRGLTWAPRSKGMIARYMPPERQGDDNAQDPHRIVRAPSSPGVMWCQHHSGVWRSTDDAASWHELEVPPSRFGFAVAVHPRDAESAWFVPADSDATRIPLRGQVVVARTRDGGRSFTVLTTGLPQQHAYDLVYRHALAIDRSGDRLAFGSTTGSLWETDDGGDSWRTVSTHLPPVCVVRSA